MITSIEQIEKIISAAHDLNRRLLGTEATADDIQTALVEECEGWTEEEQQLALRLACEFALIAGDPDEGMDLDEDSAHARVVHYHYLFLQFMEHLGRIDNKLAEKEDERMSYQEIHDRYPLRKTSDETH